VKPRPDKEVLERLGPDGLLRVLDDLLDQGRLVRLANACALRYPGMRTQSQKRDRILRDLVQRTVSNDAARKATLKVLRKEAVEPASEWATLPAEERRRRVSDEAHLVATGNLGVLLFLLADGAADGGEDEMLSQLLQRPDVRPEKAPAPDPAASGTSAASGAELGREVLRLRKKNAEVLKKLQHLEAQWAKSREAEKVLKRDLMRRKGELAESRMLAERLSRELEDARGAARRGASAAVPSAPSDQALSELAKSLRKLADEQRKLTHRLAKLEETPPPEPVLPPEALQPVLSALEELHKETAALRRERRKDLQEQARRLEELRAQVKAAAEAAESAPGGRRPGRRKGEPERVGVFVDVQNMWYAARQLKGKLDFDALLQAAVRDRRLIQAAAYVVETKEIDQSGFIAMLQQRGITVHRKTLKVRADGSMKGDWDMEMALDILDAAPKLDVVVLVSGDGDFTSLVKRVKAMGPRVEVVAFPRNTAKSLLEAADRFQPLDRKFMIRAAEPPAAGTPRQAAASEPALAGTGN
jgi:uncharacterized LabA/DUF88 family protein